MYHVSAQGVHERMINVHYIIIICGVLEATRLSAIDCPIDWKLELQTKAKQPCVSMSSCS